jgi:PAS domain S-box-containing protein
MSAMSARIFIVEDEALIAMEIEDHLRELGYEPCGRAARGERAIDEILSKRPDLLLLDVHLAGDLSGIDVARALRGRLDVPSIFLTAYSDAEIVRNAVDTGSAAYLVKPFEPQVLRANIEMALYKHAAERRLREANQLLEQRANELRESALRYERLIENVHDAIIVDDLEGRLAFANRRFRDWFGFGNRDAREIVLEDYVSPEWRATLRDRHDRRMRGEDVPERFEYEGVRPDGQRIWLEALVTKIEEDGRIIGAQSAIRDITERRRSEERLRQAEKLAALGLLLGGVAHEVRNPLFGLSAIVDAMLEELHDEPRLAEFTSRLRRELGRIEALMQELLDYGRQSAEIAELDVGEIVRRAVRHLDAARLAPGCEVALDVAPELPAVAGDAARLASVFQNLVENALQHTPRGGRIEITVGPGDEGVVCAVGDEGPGFPPADLPQVFEPFFTRRKGGTGMGLALVRRIVSQHGGTVRAGNKPQGGAVVTVTLPAARRGDA